MHEACPDLLQRAGYPTRLAASLEPEPLRLDVEGAVAILTRDARVDAALMDAAPHLRVIGVHGVGTDGIAIDEASRRGIAVVNTPGANAHSVAEHALALTFNLAKAVHRGDRAARSGDATFKFRTSFLELAGATFGVVGFGAIGRATARLAQGLGMNVLVWTRHTSDPSVGASDFSYVCELDELLARSDVVSLHLPSTSQTRGLIDAERLARMKPTAFLINTARGALIDERALADAIRRAKLGGAGLDVFAQEPLPAGSPLIGLDNVILTPHVAGSTGAALRRTATILAQQVTTVLAGDRPKHLVNAHAWPTIRARFLA